MRFRLSAMRHSSAALWAFLCVPALSFFLCAAEAKQARCFTSDDGDFPCEFFATDRDGSFRISAPGKPSMILNIDAPGVAYGFVNFGERNISLPGRYLRSKTDPACWENDSTHARICAR